MVPGTPRRNSRPAMPASAAARATAASSAAAPARTRVPSTSILPNAAGQPHHHAGNAAIAHQQVGADADHADAQIGGLGGQEGGQVVGIGGTEQDFRRAAGAEPDKILQRRVLGIGAAHRRKHVAGTGHHHASPSSFFCRLFIQPVIEPAPAPTIAPPGLA